MIGASGVMGGGFMTHYGAGSGGFYNNNINQKRLSNNGAV
jgi:hypothetical protein